MTSLLSRDLMSSENLVLSALVKAVFELHDDFFKREYRRYRRCGERLGFRQKYSRRCGPQVLSLERHRTCKTGSRAGAALRPKRSGTLPPFLCAAALPPCFIQSQARKTPLELLH